MRPRVTGFLRIKMVRPGKQEVAVREIQRPRVAVVGIMMRHRAKDARGKLDLINVPERFLDEQNPSSVVRPVRAFAEPCDAPDPRREMVHGAFAFFRRGFVLRGKTQADERDGSRQQEEFFG
ncbi:MAG: hypothetical protein DME23_27270 [Verrucomicrobia bacterium]|nr:MAG: hypothetical protein DME23_27270 [Verrucomicrobiota bacterium]